MTQSVVAPPSDLLSRDAKILGLTIFVVGYGTNVSTPFLVLYKERLGLGASATMAIFVVYVVGIMATLFLVGPTSDRFGRRPVVLPFTLLSAVASLTLIPGRNSFALLLLGRLLLGMVSGAVLAIGAAWMQELVGRGHELRAAVLATVVGFLGFGFGPLVSAVFEAADIAPLVAPFVLHAIFVVLAMGLILRVPETHPRPNPPPPFRVQFGVPAASRSSFLKVIVPAAVWVFGFPSTSFALFPVLVSDSISGAEVAVAAASGMITAWSATASRPVLNRIGANRALPVAMWIGVVGYVLGTVAFAAGLWGFVLPAAFCLGAASGIITSACLTLIGEMAEQESRGSLVSTFYLLAYPGMSMPLIITALAAMISSTSVALMIITAMAMGAASMVTVTARSVTRSA